MLKKLILILVAGSFAEPAFAAPDKTLGMALMSAVVDEFGALKRGSGSVSSEKIANGRYVVLFNRNVRDCTYVASLGLSTTVRDGVPGTADVRAYSSNVNGVLVNTSDGGLADRPFHLIVFCAK